MFRPMLLIALLGLLASPAQAREPRAVYHARIQLDARGTAFTVAAEAGLEHVLGSFDHPELVYRRARPEVGRLDAVFTAPDGRVPRTLKTVVRRLDSCERAPSLYRVRFHLRYGALPLPPDGTCPELEQTPPANKLKVIGETDACMDQAVRDALVEATAEEAQRMAGKQLEEVQAALSSPQEEALLVLRDVRTYLVTETYGERQEAEVVALFLAAGWSEPFQPESQRPVEGLELERVADLDPRTPVGNGGGMEQVLRQD